MTGVGDSGSEGPVDSISVAASHQSIAFLQSQLININHTWSNRFEAMYNSLDERIVSVVGQIINDVFANNPALSTAPSQVPIDKVHGKNLTDPSTSKPPTGVGRRVVRSEWVLVEPSLPSHSLTANTELSHEEWQISV